MGNKISAADTIGISQRQVQRDQSLTHMGRKRLAEDFEGHAAIVVGAGGHAVEQHRIGKRGTKAMQKDRGLPSTAPPIQKIGEDLVVFDDGTAEQTARGIQQSVLEALHVPVAQVFEFSIYNGFTEKVGHLRRSVALVAHNGQLLVSYIAMIRQLSAHTAHRDHTAGRAYRREDPAIQGKN